MGRLLLLIPLALIALGIWLITLIPAGVLAVIGFVTLVALVVSATALGVLALLAGAMAS